MSDDPVAELLCDLRVIDFTQALSGPYCTLLLADLGADVIKVEAPERGDDARHWGPPFLGQDSAYYLSVNRNKRSAALDLKSGAGRAAAERMIAGADVVIENWRPGTADRLGVGYEQARALNPVVIYCSITGFGGDDDRRAGYDQIVQGTSGAMTLTGPPGEPTKWGVPIADLAAGMFAATAIVAAVHARTATGTGRRIEIAMQDCLVSLLSHHAARQLATTVPLRSDHNAHPSIVPYGMFDAADGQVNICVGNDAQFRRMCSALDLHDTADDPRYATAGSRTVNRADLLARLRPRVHALPVAEVVQRLEDAGVPVGAVREVHDVLADSGTRARGMICALQRPDFGSAEVVNGPVRVDGAPAAVRRPPPLLGEHTAEVLAEVSR